MTNQQTKYADKIAKLLAKAESTTPEEAELLVAKAQELMTQYAIEQAMIDLARGVETDLIEQVRIYFTGNQRQELSMLAWEVCRLNNCLVVQHETLYDDGGRKAVKVFPDGRGGYRSEVTSQRKAICFEITGYKSDLDRVQLLETSLRLQAFTAMSRWWRTEGKAAHDWDTYAHKVRIKCEFVDSFRQGVGAKLRVAQQAGQANAVTSEATRTDTTEAVASTSVELVLRSRKDSVKDWYDKKYGTSLRSVRRGYKASRSAGARTAGYVAGTNADVGHTRVTGTRTLDRSN